jgi:hypothetical protein
LTDEEEMIDVSGGMRRQEKKVRKKRQQTLCVDSLELIVLDALSRPEVRGKDPEMFRPSAWGCKKSRKGRGSAYCSKKPEKSSTFFFFFLEERRNGMPKSGNKEEEKGLLGGILALRVLLLNDGFYPSADFREAVFEDGDLLLSRKLIGPVLELFLQVERQIGSRFQYKFE